MKGLTYAALVNHNPGGIRVKELSVTHFHASPPPKKKKKRKATGGSLLRASQILSRGVHGLSSVHLGPGVGLRTEPN